MYKCKKCGNVFENVSKSSFDMGYDPDCDGYASSCPDCGSDDFIEVEPCVYCGDYVGSSAHLHMCEKCEKETRAIVSAKLVELCEDMDEVEIEVLADMLDEMDITSLYAKIKRTTWEEK